MTQIRDAQHSDLPAILEIHNAAVVESTAIWDDERVDLADRIRWFDERRAAGFPVLVADVDGRVGGYATYGPWRARSGFRHTVENSVYVSGQFQRRGLATLLLTELLDRAKAAGLHVVVAGIESSNLTSIALHEKFGFRVVGQMPEVGTKFGRWLDLTFMQLTFGEARNLAP